ncbi:PAS domain S-box protein, partial [candidate division WOR-3 bacterium]|nr:PAS domain S-box protein [candidate division WOR-3 bacterium]
MSPAEARSRAGWPSDGDDHERYRLVAELTSDFVYSYDIDEQGTAQPGWIAGAFAPITGYTPDGMRLAGGWEKLVHPEDIETVGHQAAELRAGRAATVEYRIRDRSGNEHWVRDFAAPATDKGRVVRIVGAVKDITEQKRADEAYRQLVENSLQGLLVLASDRILFANEAAAEVTGWPRDELVGMPIDRWFGLLHPEDREAVVGRFRARLTGKSAPNRYEVRFVDRAGQSRWMEVFAVASEYLGEPAVQVALVDLTERRRAEEQLRALMQSVPGAVIYQTGGGVEFISENVEAVLGYPAADLTGNRSVFPALIHPDERAGVDEDYRAWAGGGYEGVHVKEFRVRHRDGHWVWLRDQTRLAFRTADGRHSAIGVLVDITAEKQAEQALRAERDRAQKYLDVVNVIFVALDRDGRVTMLNRRGAEVLGWSEQELAGRDWFETCLPERVRDEVRGAFGELMAGRIEPVEFYENPVLTRQGEERII